jgi:hypothetical protein
MTETPQLPPEIDNDTVIFSYGSLLDHGQLRFLLNARGDFEIRETLDLAEAATMVNAHPEDIVILRDARLENVRVSIVTEAILRRWYKDSGGDLQKLVDAGVTSREVPESAYLYARPVREGERGRFLNGGLICGLTTEEVDVFDKYEFETILRRTRTSRLAIQNRTFTPAYITFYAGTAAADDLTPEEVGEKSRILRLNRQRGKKSPHAKWPENIRKK